jgi:hypothetical protein
MANYGFPDLQIQIDNGAALKDISAYVTAINGVDLEQVLEELTSAGDDFPRWAEVGFSQGSDITLSGPYDDVANGPDLLKVGTGQKTLTVTIGGANSWSAEVIRKSFKWTMARGELTGYEAVVTPTGTITIS